MTIQRTSLNVSLTPKLERFIAARVASGHHENASEVVRAGLHLRGQSETRQESPAGRGAAGTLRHPESM